MPAEIRNQIYREALVESGGIVITPKEFAGRQPVLLKVRRTIRSEAIKFYYMENEFVIAVDRFNAGSVVLIDPSIGIRLPDYPLSVWRFDIGALSG